MLSKTKCLLLGAGTLGCQVSIHPSTNLCLCVLFLADPMLVSDTDTEQSMNVPRWLTGACSGCKESVGLGLPAHHTCG